MRNPRTQEKSVVVRGALVDWLLRTTGVAAAYFLFARMALLLPIYPGQATPVWPAAGIALAGILLLGRRVWPGIFLGSLAATAPIYLDTASVGSLFSSLGAPAQFAGIAVFEALLAGYLMQRSGFDQNLDRPRTILWTMLLGGPFACLVAASAGTTLLFLTGTVQGADFFLQWRNYWFGDTFGVVIFIPLILLWGSELRRTSVQTRVGVALPILLSMALTGVATFYVRAGERHATSREFERRAELMARTLEPIAQEHLDVVQAVASLFETSDIVTREEFRTFVSASLDNHPDVHGLSWNAIVPFDERADFEERMRSSGDPGFRITERGPEGELVEAAKRDRYVVVAFIEPFEGNEKALGYDLTSDQERGEALARARDSGGIVATPPILLVQETGQKPGYLLFAPVFRGGELKGTTNERRQSVHSYVSGILKAEELVVGALRAFAGEGIEYEVFDTSNPDQPRMLHSVGSAGVRDAGPLAHLDWSTSFDIAGRQWTIRLWPGPGYETAAGWSRVLAVLTGGLMFTALLGAFLLVAVGRTVAAERASQALRREVEERMREEAARRELEVKVQESQKLESLGVLAGGIAHDFNNLLMGVLGHADLALGKLGPDDPARSNLENIEIASQRAAELANQLLAYSGKARFTIEVVDLSDLVEEITDLIEVATSKLARVSYNLARDLPPVRADTTQIRQVILNLITNASEAIGESDGTITLTSGALECDSGYLSDTYAAEDLKEGSYVFVEVADTGYGMEKDTRGRIFDPFFTTKFTGRGLGLAAVLGIIRSHDGAIDVQSKPGIGTTIRVLLPATNEPLPGDQLAESSQADWASDGVILLVDDDPTVRLVVTEMLKSMGFTVLIAEDGSAAVEIYRRQADEISLVLLDLAMPRMGGEETFAELRKIRPDVKVVISSGYDEQDTMTRFGSEDLAGFIHKPYRLAPLRDVLRDVLES